MLLKNIKSNREKTIGKIIFNNVLSVHKCSADCASHHPQLMSLTEP